MRRRQHARPLTSVLLCSSPASQGVETEVGQEFIVQRSINEGVVARRAHGEQVSRHLDDVNVILPQYGEVCVQVTDKVHHLENKACY